MPRFRTQSQLWCLACAAVAMVACRTDGAVQAALYGNLTTLKAEVREAQRAQRFDRDSVEELARAVAGREVRSATGEPAIQRLRSVRACAAPLYPVLETRSARPDDAGAEAALILLEAQRLSAERAVQQYAESASGAWRAVAARACIAPRQALLRRKFFEDPDERVRRAALQAALIAKAPGDLPGLLETARLDPDALSRSLATRAVGAIGGEDAVLRLRDRWSRADTDTRLVIIEAWAMPRALTTGGEARLVNVAETEAGGLAIAAAHALYRTSREFKELGAQVMARAIADGTRYERQLVVRLASVDHPELKAAIEKASKDADPYVRVMAHAKLVTLAQHRQASTRALRKLAKGSENYAIQARAALAAAGDSSMVEVLDAQLKSKSPEHRKLAARGLLRLGRYPHVATALADDSPEVRTSVACSVLSTKN